MENSYSNNSKSSNIMFLRSNMKINTCMDNPTASGRGSNKSFAWCPITNTYWPQYTSLSRLLQSTSTSSATDSIDPRTAMKINMKEETLVIDNALVASSGSTSENGHSKNRAGGGTARCYGSKSQLGHGKEKQRTSPSLLKNKSEVMTLLGTEVAAAIPSIAAHSETASSRKICTGDWSPVDDGIEVTLPSHSGKTVSREDANSYIDCYMYAQSAKPKRLPVFMDICPE